MLQLMLQLLLPVLISFSLGLLLGAWVISSRQKILEKKLQYELSGIKANFHNAREDAHQLRSQLKSTEQQKAKITRVLKLTSGHKKFLLVRSKLELARHEIQALKAELNRREQLIFDLKDVILTLRRHLHIRPDPRMKNNIVPIKTIVRIPTTGPAEDNLQLINGINEKIANQLNKLGIVNYRQLAECSAQQLNNMQRLIGQGEVLPVQQWLIEAQHLSEQQPGGVLKQIPRIASA